MTNIEKDIKPAKRAKSRFKRGIKVPCFIISAGEKTLTFLNIIKEENILIYKQENQKFLICSKPALTLRYNDKAVPAYVVDADKGVSVDLNISKELGLLTLFSDPKMVSNVFDETFISKASGIKPDYKQLIGVAIFGFVFGGLVGLLF